MNDAESSVECGAEQWQSERLLKLYERMICSTKIKDVLLIAAEAVEETMNSERATIYLVIRNTWELESAAVIGNIAQTIRVPIHRESLAGYCACSRRAFVVSDAYGDLTHIDPGLRFNDSWDALNGFRTRDVACAPAIFGKEIYGVVQAINKRDRIFVDKDLDLLSSITRFVAYSLHQVRLYEEIRTLQDLGKEKAKFLRLMVHELKSPAAGAKMLMSALKHKGSDDTVASSVLDKVEKRMDHLLTIVHDLLEHSRVCEGGALGEVAVFDMNAESSSVAANYREDAAAAGLEMRVDIFPESLPVRFDKDGWRLVVSNLLSNAIKYTAEGVVTVLMFRDHNWAVLQVSDTGMGIPKQDIPSMFNEFFRASNARCGGIEGTGVGLTGVKDLVERFRGTMGLVSEEGKGSTFTVRLPLCSESTP